MENSEKKPENYENSAKPDEFSNLDFSTHSFVYNPKRKDINAYQPPEVGSVGSSMSDFQALQKECWNRAQNSPYISSAIDDYQGRLTGYGFKISAKEEKLKDYLYNWFDDYRNELSINMPKYVGREGVQGELYLQLTVHGADDPGFVEVDFIAPNTLVGGDRGTGKVFHPQKTTIPVYYKVRKRQTYATLGVTTETLYDEIIPSIYAAYDESIADLVKNSADATANMLDNSKATAENVGRSHLARFNKKLNGFRRFIVEWNDGLLTERNLSRLVTVITWANYYEDLKRYEMDHKKSSGEYAWVITTTPRSFAKWQSLTPEQRASTGITKKTEAGSKLILPPEMTAKLESPNLPKLSNEDADIKEMISAGANISQSSMTGNFSGTTFSGVKESGKTQSDRNKDAVARFKRFLQKRLMKAVFYLAAQVSPLKYTYSRKTVVGFKDDEEKTPIVKTKKVRAEDLLTFTFPRSSVDNFSDMVKAALGSKSGDLTSMLNIPRSTVAEMIGIQNYEELVMRKAEEDMTNPNPSGYVDPEELERLRAQVSNSSGNDSSNSSSDNTSETDE